MSKYSEKLKDPRWQKKRLEVFSRDGFACASCGDKSQMLSVHHHYYVSGREPWEYPLSVLETRCPDCHSHDGADPMVDSLEVIVHSLEKYSRGNRNSLSLLFYDLAVDLDFTLAANQGAGAPALLEAGSHAMRRVIDAMVHAGLDKEAMRSEVDAWIFERFGDVPSGFDNNPSIKPQAEEGE